MTRQEWTTQPRAFARLCCAGLILGCLQATPGLAQIPCKYEVAAIITGPPCPGPVCTANAISPNGQYVCGYWYCVAANYHAFVYEVATAQFTLLPHPANVWQSWASDVNDNGVVVGDYWKNGSNPAVRFGFVYDSKSGQYLAELPPQPGGSWCVATGINSFGTVCGWRSIGPGLTPQNAFIYETSTATFLDLGVMNGPNSAATDITENGEVVGWTGTGPLASVNTYAFRHDGQVLTILPPVPNGYSSSAEAANDNGIMVGFGRIPPSEKFPLFRYRGFVYANGRMEEIPPFEGFRHSRVVDINEDGIALGACSLLLDGSSAFAPFIWHNGLIAPLSDLLEPSSGIFLEQVRAINDAGMIVGQGQTTTAIVGFILSPAPALGDTNGDCSANILDLLNVINQWGQSKTSADLNEDGTVNEFDLFIVIENWTVLP